MTIAETVGRTVAALGCRQVFGVIGSGNFVVTRAMVDAGAGFVAARVLAQADLVIAAGASLNMWTTRHGALIADHAKVLQIDSDVDAVGAHRPVDLGIVGDVAATASALADVLRRRGHANAGFRTDEVAAALAAGGWRRQPYDDTTGVGGDWIDPRTLSIRLHEMLPAERTVAIDSGHFMGWPAMYVDVPDPQGFVLTQAFQSIGLGLASAIGAAIATRSSWATASTG